ncbi:MAG: EAL domain-containing protein [Lachnospiraceae bacterium]|nr:EAL domain-containing protein [Lachnospiraceae bacterium]
MVDVVALLNEAAFYFAAILTSLLVLIFTSIRYSTGKPQNRVFKLFVADIMIAAFFMCIKILCKPLASFNSVMASGVKAGYFGYFVFHTATAPLFALYMVTTMGEVDTKKKLRHFLMILPAVATEIMVLNNPFNEFVYSLDEGLNMHRGNGEMIVYGVGALYFLFAFIGLSRRWDTLTSERKNALVFFITMTVFGVVIQFILRQFKIELFAESLGCMGLMLAIENENDLIDSACGVYNRNTLSRNLDLFFKRNKPGYAVCLRIVSATSENSRGSADTLIKSVAKEIKSIYPWYNTYRITPTSFLMLVERDDLETADGLAELLNERIENLFTDLEDGLFSDYAVILAKLPDDLSNTQEVMLMGDSELPIAESGKRSDATQNLKSLLDRAGIEEALHRGLRENEFEIYYQPVHTTADSKLFSAEALIRQHDSVLGDVFPNDFIPVAEQNGLINGIGAFVIEQVCEFIKSGIPEKLGMDHINVNLSIVQCFQRGFVGKVRNIIDSYGISADKINFEITESVASTDNRHLSEIFKEFKAAGFKFSMDDYGTGYSNIQSVFNLDFDVIKIDKSILWEAEKSETGKIILESSVHMIKRMNRLALVEGVETEEQVKLLKDLGVDYLQGYYFSKPVPRDEFIALYDNGIA